MLPSTFVPLPFVAQSAIVVYMMNTNKPEVQMNSIAQIAAKINGVEPVWIEFSFNGFLYRTNGLMVQGKDGSEWNTTHSLSVVLAGREVWNAR